MSEQEILGLTKYIEACDVCNGKGCNQCKGTGTMIVWRNREGKICFRV